MILKQQTMPNINEKLMLTNNELHYINLNSLMLK